MGAKVPVFDGTSDVLHWAYMIKAKLMAKGYNRHLQNVNKPNNANEQAVWNAKVDKAIGMIMCHLHPEVMLLFESYGTPQTLLEAVVAMYSPDQNVLIDKLENEFMELSYDGTDPVVWSCKVRSLVAKLIANNAAPTERMVRKLVFRALELEYKLQIEIIRCTQPNISLDELWVAVKRFPYPINRENNMFAKCNDLQVKSYNIVRQQSKTVQTLQSEVSKKDSDESNDVVKVEPPTMHEFEMETETQTAVMYKVEAVKVQPLILQENSQECNEKTIIVGALESNKRNITALDCSLLCTDRNVPLTEQKWANSDSIIEITDKNNDLQSNLVTNSDRIVVCLQQGGVIQENVTPNSLHHYSRSELRKLSLLGGVVEYNKAILLIARNVMTITLRKCKPCVKIKENVSVLIDNLIIGLITNLLDKIWFIWYVNILSMRCTGCYISIV